MFAEGLAPTCRKRQLDLSTFANAPAALHELLFGRRENVVGRVR
jgi:hypothetical protein